MAILSDISSLDFAYKGFQYPVPPSWKYAVRIQDQINWLLQAICALDENGANVSEIEAAVDAAIDDFQAIADGNLADLESALAEVENRLQNQIDAINAGLYYTRNPVSGFRTPIYTALKMMYDALRTRALTWDEFDALEMTWDDLKDTGHTWLEVDLFSNDYWGTGEERAKWTNPDTIDDVTIGFTPQGIDTAGTTWEEIAKYGFIYRTE